MANLFFPVCYRTLPNMWNPISAGYYEAHASNVIVDCLGLLVLTRLIEPGLGTKELLKFACIVNGFVGITTFCILIGAYFATQNEQFLYAPIVYTLILLVRINMASSLLKPLWAYE